MSAGGGTASFVQLVSPRMGTTDATGMCLRFAQSVFGAPAMHESATVAANNTHFRHHTREMPDVAALVWFDHWGRYGLPLRYDNWGHVVAWVPGHGFLSSPPYAKFDSRGNEIPWSQWYPSVDAVERAFNAKFRFWSEDINGLRVAEPSGAAPVRKDSRMHAVRQIGVPDSGVIVGGGQPPRARHESVFVAECAALGITPVECPDWQYQTVVREAWTDFATSAQLIADAVAGKLPAGGPAPIGVSDADVARIAQASAKETNDDAARRMQG